MPATRAQKRKEKVSTLQYAPRRPIWTSSTMRSNISPPPHLQDWLHKPDNETCCQLGSYMSDVDAIISTKDLKVLLRSDGWFTTDLINYMIWEFCNGYCESVVDEEVVAFPTQVWQDWWSNRVYTKGPKHYDPLKYPFIAIPMNVQSNHWILAIVAYASDLIGDDQGLERPEGARTAIIVLDSIGYRLNAETEKLKQLVAHLLEQHIETNKRKTAWTPDKVRQQLQIYVPKVPRQENSHDCGPWVRVYLETFTLDPFRMADHCLGINPMKKAPETIWPPEFASRVRNILRHRIKFTLSCYKMTHESPKLDGCVEAVDRSAGEDGLPIDNSECSIIAVDKLLEGTSSVTHDFVPDGCPMAKDATRGMF